LGWWPEKMSGVLGVACTNSATYLAVCVDEEILGGVPLRLLPPAGIEAGGDLWAFMDQMTGALTTIRPELVVLLLPEEQGGGRRPPKGGPTHRTLAPRIAMETIVRLAVAREKIPCDVLARATVKSRLGLGQAGNLDEAIGDPPPSDKKYWSAGRGLAALAARAGELA
jgi:hypothetical protein